MRKQDPLALAVFAAALLLLAGLLLFLLFGAKRAPQSEPARETGAGSVFFERLKKELRGMAEEIRRDLPFADKAPREPAQASGDSLAVPALPAGRVWTYAVEVKPEVWRNSRLTYRTRDEGGQIGVLTDFTHAGGKMNFHLGMFAAGHASHANVRFPGFFLHASYFPKTLAPGQTFSWSWAWQPRREGRLKRYDARVLRWEDVQVPAGTYRALLIEADLLYIEGGKERARARETLWYAPAAAQVVRVVRDGRTPDEGLDRIVAELAEFR